MNRQYSPNRFRYQTLGGKVRHVGTIPAGTIFRASPYLARILGLGRRNMHMIVEAWFPREIGACRRDQSGRWQSCFVGNGGHLAQVRCLASGRRRQLADGLILQSLDDD